MSNNINKKSLCEESLLVFINILKLSSLALARSTLSSKSHDDHTSTTITTFNIKDQVSPELSPVVQLQRRSKRSQKPEQPPECKVSYVMLPEDDIDHVPASSYLMNKKDRDNGDGDCDGDGHFADYIRRFHQKTENDIENAIVEGRANDYIKKFHEKNMNDLNNESMRRLHYVLPPPPNSNVFK